MTEGHSPSGDSFPLHSLPGRRQYSRLSEDYDLGSETAYSSAKYQSRVPNMAQVPLSSLRSRMGTGKSGGIAVLSSYVFDWIMIIVLLGVAYYMNDHEPNRRPFSIEDPNISFPFTENETVPSWLLITLAVGVPAVVVPIISLIFVPGRTVPSGTPKSLIWRRRLWELHVGWLGLALAIAGTWFITNGMKNMFGKPRPDLLARCNADLENFAKYVVGGMAVDTGYQRLVSADICRGMDDRSDAQTILEDGFRSYPSGHSSAAAAGLIYLSMFIASKFAITFPFLAPENTHSTTSTAFPTRAGQSHLPLSQQDGAAGMDPTTNRLLSTHNAHLLSARRQAAAPPVYLLVIAMLPFFVSVFIASSRWFDFRHHGFDILFGFLIGVVCAFFSFRWYHLPISRGAGWAFGPRSSDKAWWAGVGSLSYASNWEEDTEGGIQKEMERDSALTTAEGRKVSRAESMGSGEGLEARRRVS